MCEQLWDERRHVAISLRQMNKGGSVCVEMRGRRLVFLKYSSTSTVAVTTLRPGRAEQRKKRNLLTRSAFLKISHHFFCFSLPLICLFPPERSLSVFSSTWASASPDQSALDTCRHHRAKFWCKHRAANSVNGHIFVDFLSAVNML